MRGRRWRRGHCSLNHRGQIGQIPQRWALPLNAHVTTQCDLHSRVTSSRCDFQMRSEVFPSLVEGLCHSISPPSSNCIYNWRGARLCQYNVPKHPISSDGYCILTLLQLAYPIIYKIQFKKLITSLMQKTRGTRIRIIPPHLSLGIGKYQPTPILKHRRNQFGYSIKDIEKGNINCSNIAFKKLYLPTKYKKNLFSSKKNLYLSIFRYIEYRW